MKLMGCTLDEDSDLFQPHIMTIRANFMRYEANSYKTHMTS